MKKIMFNDKYGLTQAVLESRKTMTRRIIKGDYENIVVLPHGSYIVGYKGSIIESSAVELHSSYQIGDEVAVAQSYKDAQWNPDTLQQIYVKKPTIFPDLDKYSTHCGWVDLPLKYHKGWTNKMFVLADLMPHRIRITNIKVERLQDISDEDCLKEGIMEGEFMNTWDKFYFDVWGDVPNHITFKTPREAFAALIDRISGKETWDSNPWVYAYEFELIK